MARGNKPTSDTETREQAAEAGATEPQVATEKKDLAVEAYVLFCKGQAEGDFPAWSELDLPTQKLWLESYAHVAGGGKPRTDYESVVKYLILSAQ
jgi:hypothetical protein